MTEPKPSDRWLDAFSREATSTLVVHCHRHARWCLNYYRVNRGPLYHHELVQDALGDILEERIAWDPERGTLYDKVCDVIRYRVRDEVHSAAERRQRLSLDRTIHACADISVELEVAIAVGVVDDPESELVRKQMRALGARVGGELAVLAGDDGEVLALLACILDGTDRRDHVLAETRMSREAYHNARRRLRRLADQLPEELLMLIDDREDPT